MLHDSALYESTIDIDSDRGLDRMIAQSLLYQNTENMHIRWGKRPNRSYDAKQSFSSYY